MRNFSKLWIPVIAYAVLIFWISSFETPFGAMLEERNIDKIVHFFEYLIFGFLLIRALHGSGMKISRKVAVLMAFLIGSLYGITDELHQSVVPGRFATISDFIFDSIGSLVGAIVFKWKR